MGFLGSLASGYIVLFSTQAVIALAFAVFAPTSAHSLLQSIYVKSYWPESVASNMFGISSWCVVVNTVSGTAFWIFVILISVRLLLRKTRVYWFGDADTPFLEDSFIVVVV